MALLVKATKHVKKKQYQLKTNFPENLNLLSDSFHEASILLKPKQDKQTCNKETVAQFHPLIWMQGLPW